MLRSTTNRRAIPAVLPTIPSPGAALHLHILLQPQSLEPLLDRLDTVGRKPNAMLYHRGSGDDTGFLALDFARISAPVAHSVVAWVKDVAGVLNVQMEWRPGAEA